MMRDLSDPMRDLSVSDSRSDSSSSPPLLPSSSSSSAMSSAALHNAQAFWAQNLGEQTSFQFGSMMYPNITSQMTCTSNTTNNSTDPTTPLHTSTTSSSTSSSNNMFDFSTAAAQQQYLYQAAAYSPWGYPAYNFQYPGIYGTSDGDFKDFKDVTLLPATTRSSSSTTPTAATSSSTLTSLGWTMTHEGKKKRQPYKKDQISRLEYEYTVNPYLTNKRRAELSTVLVLDEKQVKVWFQNRRMKDKKLKQRVAGPFPLGAPVTPSFERLIN